MLYIDFEFDWFIQIKGDWFIVGKYTGRKRDILVILIHTLILNMQQRKVKKQKSEKNKEIKKENILVASTAASN